MVRMPETASAVNSTEDVGYPRQMVQIGLRRVVEEIQLMMMMMIGPILLG
jgi:hypothetical protein